jgi:hypothetical protein
VLGNSIEEGIRMASQSPPSRGDPKPATTAEADSLIDNLAVSSTHELGFGFFTLLAGVLGLAGIRCGLTEMLLEMGSSFAGASWKGRILAVFILATLVFALVMLPNFGPLPE